MAQPSAARSGEALVSLQIPSPTVNGPWGPLALIVLDRDRAVPTDEWFCPASDDPDEFCVGADIVEGRGQIIRYLSAPTEGWTRGGLIQRFRFIGGHAVRWVDSSRSVAIVEQTDKGYRWVVWFAAIEHGFACFPDAIVEHFHIVPVRPFTQRGSETMCIRVH